MKKILLAERQRWALEDAKAKKGSWRPQFEIACPGAKQTLDKVEATAMLNLKFAESKVKTKAAE